MKRIELIATSRGVLGKKVRFLRRQGIIPVHLFGHNVESLALQCDEVQLKRVLARAGKTKLISLKLDRGKKSRDVVIREIQRDMRTGGLLHMDLYQIKMTEKIRVEVPIIVVGEAPALKSKENMLLHELSSLTVECLPGDIPANVKVDMNSLTEREQTIRVGNVILGDEVAILNDPELVVVKIGSRPKVDVEEAAVAAEAAEALGEAPLPEGQAKED